jgi:voltage-gated potassium channel
MIAPSTARRAPLLTAGIALATLAVVGTAGYMSITGLGFTDALYMTVITLTTVGYREVAPLGAAGQYFTMALLVSGFGVVIYGGTLLARDLLEGELQRGFGRRRVQRSIDKANGHVIVCGYGRMGRMVCRELVAKPADFVVVDRDVEALRLAEADGNRCIAGDATEDAVLEAAGIRRARGLVSALSTDADNVYVVLSARELNANLVIVARAEDDRSERKLLHAGATRVVSPYAIGGHRMAHALLRPTVLDVIDLATHSHGLELQIEEVEVTPGSFCDGVTLQASGLRRAAGLIVIAIRKPAEETTFNPTADTPIAAGDRLVLMGQAGGLRELDRRLKATASSARAPEVNA